MTLLFVLFSFKSKLNNNTFKDNCCDMLPSLCASLATECSLNNIIINGHPLRTFCKSTCGSCK